MRSEEKDEKEYENPDFQAGARQIKALHRDLCGAFSFIEFVSLATFDAQ